jgi:hypothetical protein
MEIVNIIYMHIFDTLLKILTGLFLQKYSFDYAVYFSFCANSIIECILTNGADFYYIFVCVISCFVNNY